MQIKVSKVLANEIAKYIKSNCKDEHNVQVEQHGEAWYRMNTPFGSFLDDTDYDWKTDKYKVIAIYRPDEYYAPAVYLTTEMLVKSFKRIAEKTLQNFMEQVWHDYIEC